MTIARNDKSYHKYLDDGQFLNVFDRRCLSEYVLKLGLDKIDIVTSKDQRKKANMAKYEALSLKMIKTVEGRNVFDALLLKPSTSKEVSVSTGIEYENVKDIIHIFNQAEIIDVHSKKTVYLYKVAARKENYGFVNG